MTRRIYLHGLVFFWFREPLFGFQRKTTRKNRSQGTPKRKPKPPLRQASGELGRSPGPKQTGLQATPRWPQNRAVSLCWALFANRWVAPPFSGPPNPSPPPQKMAEVAFRSPPQADPKWVRRQTGTPEQGSRRSFWEASEFFENEVLGVCRCRERVSLCSRGSPFSGLFTNAKRERFQFQNARNDLHSKKGLDSGCAFCGFYLFPLSIVPLCLRTRPIMFRCRGDPRLRLNGKNIGGLAGK